MTQFRYGEEEFISYLPLSHVAAQMLDIFIPIMYAITIYFAQPDALKVRFPFLYYSVAVYWIGSWFAIISTLTLLIVYLESCKNWL